MKRHLEMVCGIPCGNRTCTLERNGEHWSPKRERKLQRQVLMARERAIEAKIDSLAKADDDKSLAIRASLEALRDTVQRAWRSLLGPQS